MEGNLDQLPDSSSLLLLLLSYFAWVIDDLDFIAKKMQLEWQLCA